MERPPLLIHLHVPKTAGTTLSRMVRLRMAVWPPSHWIDHAAVLGYYHLGYSNDEEMRRRCERIRKLPEARRRRMRFFAAHAGYGLHEFLPEPSAYITVLRDPVQRVVSAFRFLQQQRAIDPGLTLEQFAQLDHQLRPYFIDNAQVRYIGGEHGRVIDTPPGRCPPEALDRALERIESEFLLTGLTERFDETAVMLGRLLGWRHPFYARSRVSRRRRAAPPDVPAGTLEIIRERNGLDLALYDRAKTLFERRVRALGPTFQREVRTFTRRNARYATCFQPINAALPATRRMLQHVGMIR